MASDPAALVETYLAEMAARRGTGAARPETSYYTPLENLLNAVGSGLKPKVFCLGQLADPSGVGSPDFGLFTQSQVQRGEPHAGAVPERGVVEVKRLDEPVLATIKTTQVSRYWGRYRLVLVTNYREFLLLGEDQAGRPAPLERFALAPDEAGFWRLAAEPHKSAGAIGRPLVEYLVRVLTHMTALAEPKDLAWLLASYARDALARIEGKPGLPALVRVREALEGALGITFEAGKGLHFFHSTLVQTLFYGLFSAWSLWAKEGVAPGARFDWRTASWYLKVPMLQALFHQLADPQHLRPLGLVEVMDWAGAALERVRPAAFFARFEQEHAVQYFYEPFLAAFDPELRRQLGVWYTPREVVRYMVERVDRSLREELGIADGLADERVVVLDPCCGTGAYLVEVLRRIDRTLDDRGLGALKGETVKRAALERVFGFEIMPAPFVVAHLQVGLFLQSLQAPLAETGGERVAVYLTNALTGWSDAAERQLAAFPQFQVERELAAHVKRDLPVLVILGNPPYNGYAGVAVDEERQLVDAYRRVSPGMRPPEGQGLNDLYVRFFRMAERRIVERTGRGIICFISNYSWLDGLSFTGMRERFAREFDLIRIDCLNGDSRKTGKVTPEGEPDPSIFSTEFNREGIQVGTAIGLLVRRAHARRSPPTASASPSPPDLIGGPTIREESQPMSVDAPVEPRHDERRRFAAAVGFRHLWGKGKWRALEATAERPPAELYQPVQLPAELGLPFAPAAVTPGYFDWPSLPELFPVSFPGVKTSRDEFLVSIDEEPLLARLQAYFDPKVSHEEMRRIAPSVMTSTARFDAEAVRDQLRRRGFLSENVVHYAYRPFDVRWLYWEPDTKLLDEKRSDYRPHVDSSNLTLVTQQRSRREWSRPLVIRELGCLDLLDRGASCIPYAVASTALVEAAEGGRHMQVNISTTVQSYIEELSGTASNILLHVLSILHAPAFPAENGDALALDWPRIPLPQSVQALLASSCLGSGLARLLEPGTAVQGVTSGRVRAELRIIAMLTRGGETKTPINANLSTGWGYLSDGAVMPGQGKAVERTYAPDELTAFAEGAPTLGLTPEQVRDLLGETTFDVWLNGEAYWRNIPAKVWRYKLGGYQVVKKWLSYRERDVLGRALKPEEVAYVQEMARRIAAILLMGPALDANYAAVKADPWPWPRR